MGARGGGHQQAGCVVAVNRPMELIAPKCTPTPKLFGHVELRSGSLTTYDKLRNEVMTIAVQRRMARNVANRRDPNSMGTGHVGRGSTAGSQWGPAMGPHTWFSLEGGQGDASGVQEDWGGDWRGGGWSGQSEENGEADANAVGKGKSGAGKEAREDSKVNVSNA